VLPQSRPEVSGNAPTYATININPEKIRDVIGKGGATIRAICEETKATIDIEDTGHGAYLRRNQGCHPGCPGQGAGHHR
jgi:polyribonucleotide nucleotidyltransferase